jgi:hypothetical protein
MVTMVVMTDLVHFVVAGQHLGGVRSLRRTAAGHLVLELTASQARQLADRFVEAAARAEMHPLDGAAAVREVTGGAR